MRNGKKKYILLFLVVAVFALNFFVFPRSGVSANTSADDIQDKLDDLNKKYEQAQAELQAETSKLYRNQAQISATRALINQIQSEIARRELELDNLNERAELNKKILAEQIRQLYYADQEDPIVKLAVFRYNLNDVTMNFDSTVIIKSKIIDALSTIKDAKVENAQTKEALADQQANRQQLLKSQQITQNQIAGEVEEKQADVAEIQRKISKLRSALSSFLGKSFSMEDVIDAVKFAEKKTGVRKEFLFAVLDKETDLGRFTGGCTYNKSKMGSTNLEYFKDICDSLGYNYKKMKVSCALSYGIGGAMGVAQFMPSTWMGYKDKIADKTGNDPADPWNLKDGIMGMALYLKNKGGDRTSGEYQAAAMYYCGSNWRRTVCRNYANTVISWSKGYDDYF